jgi:ribosome maturation factor RimP
LELTKEILNQWVDQAIEGTPVFLVTASIQPNRRIQVIIDSDPGVMVDGCANLHRILLEKLDALDPDHTYTVDVSSPGAEYPLKMPRQFAKHVGRKVEVNVASGKAVGFLKAIENNTLVIEEPHTQSIIKTKSKARSKLAA